MTTIANILPNGETKRILADYVKHERDVRSALRQAGLVESNADLQARAAAPGNVTSIPFYNPLSGASVQGSDDLTQKITPGNMTADESLAVRAFRNASWGGSNLTRMVTGFNPRVKIAEDLGEWEALDEQAYFMRMFAGVLADAKANTADNMFYGDGTTKLDNALLLDAAQTKGENKDKLKTLIVHSAVHNRLQKDNLIVTVPASEQNVGFDTYLGKRLVISDAMTEATGVYTSILCGPGIINYGDAEPEMGRIAVVEDHTGGMGSGGFQLVLRRQFIANVTGYSYTGAANPSDAALVSASNYVRKVNPKLIPFVFLQTDLT